jgi:NAD(P)H-hydrate epimerase
MNIPFNTNEIPYLSTAQMVEVDRAMIEDYHIELIQMMENAGRNLAHLARVRFLDGDPRRKKIVVLAGTGGNGGGALVCARRLANWGASVSVILTKPSGQFAPVPGHQLDILKRMEVLIFEAGDLDDNEFLNQDLLIDGIIGYSLKGSPRGTAAKTIRWANNKETPILALDAPSGVDAGTGAVFNPAIKASATMTLALPKKGLMGAEAGRQIGELYLADISVPPRFYSQPPLALDVGPIFATGDIIRLR